MYDAWADERCLMPSSSRSTERTMRPRESPLVLAPCIVYVFPDPVWPYAKQTALKPSSTASTSGAATSSKISGCWLVASKTWSKVNARPIPSGPARADSRRTVMDFASSWTWDVTTGARHGRTLT